MPSPGRASVFGGNCTVFGCSGRLDRFLSRRARRCDRFVLDHIRRIDTLEPPLARIVESGVTSRSCCREGGSGHARERGDRFIVVRRHESGITFEKGNSAYFFHWIFVADEGKNPLRRTGQRRGQCDGHRSLGGGRRGRDLVCARKPKAVASRAPRRHRASKAFVGIDPFGNGGGATQFYLRK